MNIYEYRAGNFLRIFTIYIYIYILLCLLFHFKLAYNLLFYVFKIISGFSFLLHKDCLITLNSKHIFPTITMLQKSFLYLYSFCILVIQCSVAVIEVTSEH